MHLDLLLTSPMIVRGIDCGGWTDFIHETDRKQCFRFRTRREIDSIEIGKSVEDRVHFVAVDVAKFHNLSVRIGIHDFCSAAVVTEKRHIGHRCDYIWDEPCCGNGDASTL